MQLSQEEKPRIVVLLPESLAGDLDFAQKIHWLARRNVADVLYLAMLDDPDHGLSVSRGLATMKAVTESEAVHAGSVKTAAPYWYEKLTQVYRPGDTVVCLDQQTVKLGLGKTQPMAVYLETNLTKSVISLAGFYNPRRSMLKSWINSLIFWLGALALVAGFTVLELQANSDFTGAAHQLVLILILLIEFGAVWFWSRIIRH